MPNIVVLAEALDAPLLAVIVLTIGICFRMLGDPAVSPHYQVLSIPYLHEESVYKSMVARGAAQLDPLVEKSQWPPSTFILYVFSSRSGQWEERSFAREGNAAGVVAEARSWWDWNKRGSAYWRQALYVQYQTNVVMRYIYPDHSIINYRLNLATCFAIIK